MDQKGIGKIQSLRACVCLVDDGDGRLAAFQWLWCPDRYAKKTDTSRGGEGMASGAQKAGQGRACLYIVSWDGKGGGGEEYSVTTMTTIVMMLAQPFSSTT